MTYRLWLTPSATTDLDRLFEFWADRDLPAAERAMEAIEKAWAVLEDFPFTCRKATPDNSFLRELHIHVGHSGYVALFEIDNGDTVTVLADRHQREEDYQ